MNASALLRFGTRSAAVLCVSFALLAMGCSSIPQRPERLERASYDCMTAAVKSKVPADLPQGQAHCLATGFIARYCSPAEAYLAAVGKELRDFFGPGDAEWADWRADRAGIRCAEEATDDHTLAACCAARSAGESGGR